METSKVWGRKNPVETANLMSLLLFGWLMPLFWKGARQGLKMTDLYDPLTSDKSKRLGDRLEKEWQKELRKGAKELTIGKNGENKRNATPNIVFAIFRMIWIPYTILGVLTFVQTAIMYPMLPIFQGFVIRYFTPAGTAVTKEDALIYAGLLTVTSLSLVTIQQHVTLRYRRIGMCVRVACCSIIYRKVLRLNQSTVNTAAGQAVNLMSNDVARLDECFTFLHFLWIMPIQVSLVGYVMWKSVNIAAVAGIGTIFLQGIIVQGLWSIAGANMRSRIAVKTDKRVQLTSELIHAMQVVKMYCWEKPFALIVDQVRTLEMKIMDKASFLRALSAAMTVFSEKVTLYFTLITFVLMGNFLTAETTFVIAGFYTVLRFTCTIYVPRALILAGETSVSLKRITQFLLLDEVNCLQTVDPSSVKSVLRFGQDEQEIGIDIHDLTANWIHGKLPPTLCKISMTVRSRSLCAVVGHVGSGKSSLLHLLLGELPVGAGKLSLFTDGTISNTRNIRRGIRISYASQSPWLFSASVRDNILFGQPYDEDRYKEVTRVCALHKDFEQLPDGDLSFVGERGASLSGGQKARVNLARAVYRDADLYLLDDPLSAVDPRVGRHLFEECFTQFLKDKTRILVTHQLQYLRSAEKIVVLERGTVKFQGTHEELVESNLRMLDAQEPAEVECEEKNDQDELECKTTTETSSVVDDEQLKVAESDKKSMDIVAEGKATGNIPMKVYTDYFLAGANVCSLAILVTVIILAGVVTSGTDYWVTYWTNQETLRAASSFNAPSDGNITHCNESRKDYPEIFSSLFDACGLLLPSSGIYVYTVLILGCLLLNILQCTMFMRTCMNSSRKIHDSMLRNLLQAPMRFFNINPSGRILNRFSKDIGTMDELMPRTMIDTLRSLRTIITICGMVIIVECWMIIPIFVLCASFFIMCTYYLKTAQEIRRFEAIAKSPLFSHVSLTLNGLTTIRSRGDVAEKLLRREFDRHQDVHTGIWFVHLSTASAFGLFVDMISTTFIGCVCFSLILIDDGDTLPGYVGLAISQSLGLLGSIQYGLKQYTMMISYMTSIERVLEYANLPKEGPFITENPPPPTWPSEGSLIMKNVTMRYAEHKPPVLKNVNVRISPGWKVGIIGRTGAGKSSLISALFRLTGEGLEGNIILDGTDTGSLGLHELRPHISIIPQEPVLFSATLRENLDPFNGYNDDQLWDTLREVELGHDVQSLDFHVDEGGANFSVGQRQLICLARAILKNNKILVLDEATANIDHGTDALIQRTIRRRFANCTVLTIAHRLNTIMDSDRVLVMAGGEIVEFGHPHLLLENADGHFSQMLQQTGNLSAKRLADTARTAYLLNPEFRNDHTTVSDNL